MYRDLLLSALEPRHRRILALMSIVSVAVALFGSVMGWWTFSSLPVAVLVSIFLLGCGMTAYWTREERRTLRSGHLLARDDQRE